MLEATLWGFVGGGALLLGAGIALWLAPSQRVVAFIMAFGAGVLISAVAFDLTEEAIAIGGGDSATIGLVAGALTFFAGDRLIDRRGGRDRKRSGGQQAEGDPQGIVLGALLDGIPESAAIGLTLIAGGGVSVSFIVAVFLSNLPESISATTGLRAAGHSPRWVLALWLAVCVASAIAAGLGYQLLGGASGDVDAIVKAFAGGAILCMLTDTMMPEAFEQGGARVGLVTVAGFALAALLSTA